MAIRRAYSYTVQFNARYKDGQPATGKASTITVRICKDGGTPATSTNSVSEISATNAPGWYSLQLTASETDADSVLVIPTSSDSDVVCTQVLLLTDTGGVTVREFLSTALTSVADAVWTRSVRTLSSFGTLASDVANAVWAYVIETGLTAIQWARFVIASTCNRRTADANGNVAFRDFNDTKNRIVGSEDNLGNRTISSRDGS